MCGVMTEPLEGLYALPMSELISWNALIIGYGDLEDGKWQQEEFGNVLLQCFSK